MAEGTEQQSTGWMGMAANGISSSYQWVSNAVTGTSSNDYEPLNSDQKGRYGSTQSMGSRKGSKDKEMNVTMKIGMDDDKKQDYTSGRILPTFWSKMQLSCRVGIAVIISSIIQMRNDPYGNNHTEGHDQEWYFFPSWYYIGGLSYCAVAIIFAVCENLGGTISEICHAFFGVGFSLLYNVFLFRVLDVELYNPEEDNKDEKYYEIDRTFSGVSYYVNQSNFFYVLPWLMLFVVIIVVLPLHTSTKKFALAYDLFFTLTVINPTDPLNGDQLKEQGDWYFQTDNILHNLELYFVVGMVGWAASILVMMIPYPLFAFSSLRFQIEEGADEVLEILNLIVDTYCFKHKTGDTMKFLDAKLKRMFDSATAREQRMKQLVDDLWWEQLFGLQFLLSFNRSMLLSYIRLLSTLLSDLRQLNFAMELESYDALHAEYMRHLQREVHLLQRRAETVLDEVSTNIHDKAKKLDLKTKPGLEQQMEKTLQRFHEVNDRILRSKDLNKEDLEDNLAMNLFFFSFNSYCASLISFEEKHNAADYSTEGRFETFMKQALYEFVDMQYYDRLHMVSALKLTVAMCGGIFLAVYVFDFDSTTPAAVAYVMGNHIGGAFSVTVNRVGGVVAGCVIPSILQFFIAQVCHPQYLNDLLMNGTLFFWVTLSMYVRFSSDYWWYGGLVSAFVSAGILLKQTDVCLPGGTDSAVNISTSSYSSLAQNSVGIVLFILMEALVFPESSMSILRKNIQKTLTLLEESFDTLFRYHLTPEVGMDPSKLDEVREKLRVKIPKLIAEQNGLITQAAAEPTLWKAEFSKQKYDSVHDLCQELLNNNNLLYKLMRWYKKRLEQNKVDEEKTADIRKNKSQHTWFNEDEEEDTVRRWTENSDKFLLSVHDAFATLHTVFSEEFLYTENDKTAVFMQMKEAFRMADTNCSGEISSSEVANMLQQIFQQTGAASSKEISKHVKTFMMLVDKDGNGTVSFEEFMDALENGLQVETQVYKRNKPKASRLAQGKKQRKAAAGKGPKSQSTKEMKDDEDATAKSPLKSSSTGTNQSWSERNDSMPDVPMQRSHDVLNVSDFSLTDVADDMRSAFVEWLMEDQRFEQVTMEELVLLNCLVSGAEGIARQMTELQEAVLAI